MRVKSTSEVPSACWGLKWSCIPFFLGFPQGLDQEGSQQDEEGPQGQGQELHCDEAQRQPMASHRVRDL